MSKTHEEQFKQQLDYVWTDLQREIMSLLALRAELPDDEEESRVHFNKAVYHLNRAMESIEGIKGLRSVSFRKAETDE